MAVFPTVEIYSRSIVSKFEPSIANTTREPPALISEEVITLSGLYTALCSPGIEMCVVISCKIRIKLKRT